jgi:hypothetical protein
MLLSTLVASPSAADGVPIGTPGTIGTLTHYEAFVLTGCTPCVREIYPVVTIPIASVKAPTFPRSAGVLEGPTRSGELEFSILRAYPAGHVARQQLALRIALSVVGGQQGQTFLLSQGLVDESDVPALAAALGEIAQATGSLKSPAEMSDLEVHSDNVRIGIVRTTDQPLVYIQAWSSVDLPRLPLKQVWEVPSFFLPLGELPALERALDSVRGKIRQLRTL